MSIEVKEVSKNYGTQKAVQSISFSVSAGSVVGFLGPNGAGKSTTLKMIAGYLTPDAGSILVHGIDVVKDPITAKKTYRLFSRSQPALLRHVRERVPLFYRKSAYAHGGVKCRCKLY